MTIPLKNTLIAIDALNSEDPNSTIINDISQPKELVYGRYMTQCLLQYWPQANEFLQIAVRAQHIKRWHFKRSEFPMGKQGYLTWRKELGKFHAQTTKQIMLVNGYMEEDAERTACIIRKEKLKRNEDSQTLEDVACLVFLQYYFDEFAAKYTAKNNEEKIIRIVKMTWGKMSDKGHEIALSLTLPDHLATLVNKALS
jgi:hypothetical protein